MITCIKTKYLAVLRNNTQDEVELDNWLCQVAKGSFSKAKEKYNIYCIGSSVFIESKEEKERGDYMLRILKSLIK